VYKYLSVGGLFDEKLNVMKITVENYVGIGYSEVTIKRKRGDE
jgi:hypothetical protein